MATLVLIPGLLSDSSVWQPLADAAKARMRAHHADVTLDASIPAMATRILAEIEGDLIAIGHSMGGRVAMEMARQAPQRVRGLVLANTGYQPRRDGEEARRQQMIDLGNRDMEALADQWLPPMLDPARTEDTELLGRLKAMVLRAGPDVHARQIRALLDRPDAGAYMADLHCPILLVAARQDGWSPIAQHSEIAEATPDSELVVVENAGHFAPVERPDDVVAAICDWLDRRFGRPMLELPTILDTPLFDRAGSIRGYRLNKMAMALGKPANREAFKGNEEAYLDSFGLTAEEKDAVMRRDWHEMVRLGGNLFFILKIAAVDPTPITAIGAAQAGMSHDDFLYERLGKKRNG
ncbi:MAG: alpha/beta fold hydrolase [Hydrogenophaga sp.]|nr:alpha/beta fold hydrolase [Hydrogenophaga sp.]